MEWSNYLTLFLAVFTITNPIGSVAIFISLVSDRSIGEQRRIAVSASITIFVVLVIVTWIGSALLVFFGIAPAAFASAGALIIILLGLSMINAHEGEPHSSHHTTTEEVEESKQTKSIAVIPLAIPIVAGPGAITTIIIHIHTLNTVEDKFLVSGLWLVLALFFLICFYFSNWITRVISPTGIKVLTRIMGLILAAIGFQLLGEGLTQLLPGLA